MADPLPLEEVVRLILRLPLDQQRRALPLFKQLYGGTPPPPPPPLVPGTVPTIIEVMESPQYFGHWFSKPSWEPWKAFLSGLFGLPMSPEREVLWREFTERAPPTKAATEAWMVVGRRGGKSRIAALIAVYLACFRDYEPYLSPGEVATIPIISMDRDGSRTVMSYAKAFLAVPALRGRVVGKPLKESVSLRPHVQIEVQTANFKSVRSYTVGAAICDEIAFWDTSEEAANPDAEVLKALIPTMASIPGAMLIGLSSPYARKGVLWDRYEAYWGKDVPELIWQAPTESMNVTIDPAFIKAEYAKDPESAAAEYGAQFRTDVGSFVDPDAVTAVTVAGREELRPLRGVEYFAFCDPSGGMQDSMTLAIAHQDGPVAILDCLREVKPPFSPEAVVTEFCEVLRRYRVTTVTGDKYAGEWPPERFRTHKVSYEPAELDRSALYLELLAGINSKSVQLLDHPRMRRQLLDLERKTARKGQDTVDHPPRMHDDVINAAAGALVLVMERITVEVLDMDTDEEETPTARNAPPKKPLTSYQKQLRAQFPKGFVQKSSEEVCGNCLNFVKDRGDGKGFCTERVLQVDAPDPKCEFFDFDDIKELYPDGDDDDPHPEDDDDDD